MNDPSTFDLIGWPLVFGLGVFALIFCWAGWLGHEVYGGLRDRLNYERGFRNGVKSGLRVIGSEDELEDDEVVVG